MWHVSVVAHLISNCSHYIGLDKNHNYIENKVEWRGNLVDLKLTVLFIYFNNLFLFDSDLCAFLHRVSTIILIIIIAVAVVGSKVQILRLDLRPCKLYMPPYIFYYVIEDTMQQVDIFIWVERVKKKKKIS